MAAPGRTEQAGDLGYRRVAGFDAAWRYAEIVLGLGHDQLERDLVGRRGVAELMHPRSSFRARHRTAPGTRRPQVRTTLAAAALAGFGLADGPAAAAALAATAPAAVLTGTVPTTLPGSNMVTCRPLTAAPTPSPSACRPTGLN